MLLGEDVDIRCKSDVSNVEAVVSGSDLGDAWSYSKGDMAMAASKGVDWVMTEKSTSVAGNAKGTVCAEVDSF